MLGLSGLSRPRRLLIGMFVLLLVDVIWVASSELTEYIFHDTHYDKPYFTNYLKNSMFIIYLAGFLLWSPWRQQCRNSNMYMELSGEEAGDSEKTLSEPIYVPVKRGERGSGSESDEGLNHKKTKKLVRFNNLSEVRQLSESQAEDAALARMSYSAYLRAEELRIRSLSKLPIKYVAKLAFLFCVLYFFANLSYQEALKDTEAGIVNVLSSTSGLFTLILAAMFPSSALDRFTLSKFFMVLLSIGGVVLVSLADMKMESSLPLGALWALSGALLYAVYLVLLRRKADNEDKLDIPMFFGFVGLFTAFILWPGFFILHFSKAEEFQLPNGTQWFYLVINGLVGTVISEFLWLLGCFLTSSLVATLSLSMTIPLTMVADTIIKGVSYNWMFYVGSVPVFLSFIGVSVLTHWENWDPMCLALKKLIQCLCRSRLLPRFAVLSISEAVLKTDLNIKNSIKKVREIDKEQTESLIGINDGRGMEA